MVDGGLIVNLLKWLAQASRAGNQGKTTLWPAGTACLLTSGGTSPAEFSQLTLPSSPVRLSPAPRTVRAGMHKDSLRGIGVGQDR
jgi:hypothetical protein